MFDIWLEDMNLTVIVLAFTLFIVLPLQLILCFKVKALALRLLPTIVFAAVTLFFIALSAAIGTWDALFYTIFAIYAGFMTAVTGIAWGIWWIVKLINRKTSEAYNERKSKMELKLTPITQEDIPSYKADMQEAFRMGAVEGGFPEDDGEILSEGDIDRSLNAEGAVAYKAVLDGETVGGAIIVLDTKECIGHLDFLYVKHGIQSKGIGKSIWFEIERLHPEIKVWHTCTPYFEKRNIHFYVNVCKFCIVEFFNEHHKDPNEPQEELEGSQPEGYFDGMFEFRKEIE